MLIIFILYFIYYNNFNNLQTIIILKKIEQHQIKKLSFSSSVNIDLDRKMSKKKNIFVMHNVHEMGMRITIHATINEIDDTFG